MKTEQFCQEILGLKIPKVKAFCNLIVGLSENAGAQSVVSLSDSPHYYYTYSSINSAIKGLYSIHPEWSEAEKTSSELALEQTFLGLIGKLLYPNSKEFILLNTDITSILREHSRCLAEQEVVYKPTGGNRRIKGNKPVGIGHHVSCIGYSAGELEEQSLWNIPLSLQKVPLNSNKNSFTGKQVSEVVNSLSIVCPTKLIVNCLDSNYSSPEYIVETYDHDNLVNIIRLACNRNVWEGLSEQAQAAHQQSKEDNRGAKKVYGKQYKLSESDSWDIVSDAAVTFDYNLQNGREIVVEVNCWYNRKIRSKRGHNMKDKPFDLIQIIQRDKETGKPLHKRPLWLMVIGKRKGVLDLKSIFEAYRKRFNIEHFFRFAKQKLLLNKYQTPEIEHSKNWLKVVQVAYQLLWVAQEELKEETLEIPKWRTDLKNKEKELKIQGQGLTLSPSQVQDNIGIIFSRFDPTPFQPKTKKNGLGRKKGQTQPKRKEQQVHFKTKKKVKKKKSCIQT